jgi:hypothetical protein
MFEPAFRFVPRVGSFRSVMALDGTLLHDFELADCNSSSSSLAGPYASLGGDLPGRDANPFPAIDPLQFRARHENIHEYGFDHLLIIDARFEYEYAGGHIRGAINVKSNAEMIRLFDQFSGSSVCVIFHCEFSKNRGPTLMRNFREYDRLRNLGSYPALTYPTIYLLQGGYKEFYHQCSDLCDGGYVSMSDPKFVLNGLLRQSMSLYRAQALSQPIFSMQEMRSVPDESQDRSLDSLCLSIGPMINFDAFPIL